MHMMIDIETLGSRPGSVIASIGAVAFDPEAGTIGGDGLSVLVDLADAQKMGLRIDAETVGWWLRQSEAARAGTFAAELHRVPLVTALGMLSGYCQENGGVFAWSHGAVFDLVLLDSAYFVAGLTAPWKFWHARDTRTIFHLAGVNPKDHFEPGATAHNALDDARAQARAVIAAYAKLGLARLPQPISAEASV